MSVAFPMLEGRELEKKTRVGGVGAIRVLFWVLIAVELIPVWSARYFPSQDGAAHLESAQVLLRWVKGDVGPWREFYWVNLRPVPNWAGHVVLAGLMGVGFSALVAEKILLSGYVLLLLMGMRYLLQSFAKDAEWAAVLAGPFVYHTLLHMGFYSFCLGVGVALFGVGYWVRVFGRSEEGDAGVAPTKIGVFGVILLIAYFCHLFCLVGMGAVIGGLVLGVERARMRRVVLWTLVAGVPTLTVFVALIVLQMNWPVPTPGLVVKGNLPKGPVAAGLSGNPLRVIAELPTVMVSYGSVEIWPAVVAMGVMGIAAVGLLVRKFRARFERRDLLLIGAMVFAVVAVGATGVEAREFFVRPRAELFCVLVLAVWIGAQEFSLSVRRAMGAVAIAATIASCAIYTVEYRRLNATVEAFVALGNSIEAGKTVLPVYGEDGWKTNAGERVTVQVSPVAHAGGYLAVRRGCIDLSNYEANTDHFPILFRTEKNPYAELGRGIELQPPVMDLSETGAVRVDYVLVWGEARELEKKLLGWGYERVKTETCGTLWRRRG